MSLSIQEATVTIFNAVEIPEQLIEPLKGYIDVEYT